MRLSRVSLLLSSIAMIYSGIANADWQYTKWGMSVAQVKAASKGNAVEISKPEERSVKAKILLRGTYESPAGHFDTAFFFAATGNRLDRVNLSQRSAQECQRTASALREKYGPPEEEPSKAGGSLLWRDVTGGNLIQFHDTSYLALHFPNSNDAIPAFCVIAYEPLQKPESNGL